MPSPAYELTRCPVCESAEAREIASAEDIRGELELLWEFHERRLRAGTPTARLTDRVAFSQRPPLRLVRCDVCGTVYRNPREREYEVRDTYADAAPTTQAMAALLETQRASHDAEVERLTAVAGRVGRGL